MHNTTFACKTVLDIIDCISIYVIRDYASVGLEGWALLVGGFPVVIRCAALLHYLKSSSPVSGSMLPGFAQQGLDNTAADCHDLSQLAAPVCAGSKCKFIRPA